VDVAISWHTLFELVAVVNSRFAVGISILSAIVPEI